MEDQEPFWPDDILRVICSLSGVRASSIVSLCAKRLGAVVWDAIDSLEWRSDFYKYAHRLRYLKQLNSRTYYEVSEGEPLTALVSLIKRNTKHLTRLCVPWKVLVHFANEDPAGFTELTNGPLRDLELFASSAECFSSLATFNKVTRLSVQMSYKSYGIYSYNQVCPELISAISAGCKAVTTLRLNSSVISDAEIRMLHVLPNLKALSMRSLSDQSIPWAIQHDSNPNIDHVLSTIRTLKELMPPKIGLDFYFSDSSFFCNVVARGASAEIIGALLAAGVNINNRNLDTNVLDITSLAESWNWTPPRGQAVLAMLQAGADLGLLSGGKYRSFFTAIAGACRNVPVDVMQRIFTTHLAQARHLHPENAEFLLVDSDGATALMHAVGSGFKNESARWLWDNRRMLGLSEHDVDNLGNTAAHIYCERYRFATNSIGDNIEAIASDFRQLRTYGVDFNRKNVIGQSPVHLASVSIGTALIENADALGMKIDAFDLNVSTGRYCSGPALLLYICHQGKHTALRRLLQAATKESMQGDVFGLTPLHAACMTPLADNAFACVNVILEYKEKLEIDIDAPLLSTNAKLGTRLTNIHPGITPLHSAVTYNHLEAVKALVKAGANVAATPLDGKNAFILSAERGTDRIMEALVSGINGNPQVLNHKDRDGDTALIIIARRLGMYGFDPAKAQSMIATIASACDNDNEIIDAKDSRGRTALWYSCRRRVHNISEFLRKCGADPLRQIDEQFRDSLQRSGHGGGEVSESSSK